MNKTKTKISLFCPTNSGKAGSEQVPILSDDDI